MDWFLYDNGLRHERVNDNNNLFEVFKILFGKYFQSILNSLNLIF